MIGKRVGESDVQKVEIPLEQKGKRWEMILQNILSLEKVRDYSANMNKRKFICEIMGLMKSGLLMLYANIPFTMYNDLAVLY